MKKFTQSLIVILSALISTFIFTAYNHVSPKPRTITTCTLNLQIFVRQGHNINYSISGQTIFQNVNSDWKGNFVKEDGLSFPAFVHFDGPAIYFILDTVSAEQGRIFGTGIMDSNLDTCAGNGGGTISGPAADDLGNWRGRWLRETTVIPEENTQVIPVKDTPAMPDTSDAPQEQTYYYTDPFQWAPLTCVGLPIGAFLLLIAILRVVWLLTPHYTTTKSRKRNVHNASLQKVSGKTNAEMAGNNRPVVEYLATYTNTDKLFDITFQIEEGMQYLGECGVLVSKTLDAKLTKATAFEIWAFDGKTSQTTSRILMSHFCNHEEILRSEMQQKGEALLIQPGETINMQTEKLKISAKILEIEYMADTTYPRSVFKKVAMQIDIWKQ